MTPLAQRIANAVYQNSPRVLCFTCLAAQQAVKEHDLRTIALVLMTRAGLRVVRRGCSACQRAGEVLLAQNAA
jgi:hypothetical protein